MSRILQVPTTITVQDPAVIIRVDPTSGEVGVTFSETCPSCSGYGSPCPGGCSSGRLSAKVEPAGLAGKIGPDGITAVRHALETLLARLE